MMVEIKLQKQEPEETMLNEMIKNETPKHHIDPFFFSLPKEGSLQIHNLEEQQSFRYHLLSFLILDFSP